eukprot:351655-Chlamydomonas_euryale.AAC.2
MLARTESMLQGTTTLIWAGPQSQSCREAAGPHRARVAGKVQAACRVRAAGKLRAHTEPGLQRRYRPHAESELQGSCGATQSQGCREGTGPHRVRAAGKLRAMAHMAGPFIDEQAYTSMHQHVDQSLQLNLAHQCAERAPSWCWQPSAHPTRMAYVTDASLHARGAADNCVLTATNTEERWNFVVLNPNMISDHTVPPDPKILL